MRGQEKSECEKREQSESEFIEFLEMCLDEGWCPTKCSEDCIVESDGTCPHGFESIAVQYGFV